MTSILSEQKVARTYATPLGKLTKKQINALLMAGQRMSNWFFNMKQSVNFDSGNRATFAGMQDEWDAIRYPKTKREPESDAH